MLKERLMDKEFLGRSQVLSLLDKRVEALKEGYRQNIAITGQCLAGKTYLLHHFLDNIKDPALLPVYVEVADEPFPEFAERFMGTLLYAFLKAKKEFVREDLDFLLEKAQPYMPHTTKAIQEIRGHLVKKDFNRAYVEILNLTSIVKKETQARCIVIFDEFQNLSFFDIKDPFTHFGKVIMIQKDTMYIISSSDKSAINKILVEQLALLFGNFEIIELRGFDFNSSKQFVENKLAGFNLNEGLKSFVVAFTDGNPFYMDLVCAKLRDLALASSATTIHTSTIVEAIEGVFFDNTGAVNQYFTNRVNNLYMNNTTLNMLVAISKGLHTVKEIKESIGISHTEASSRLRRLIELNIIFKNCNFYFFIDRGFLFWVREVYSRKRTSLIASASMREEQFKHDMHNYLSKFLFDLRKDNTRRIADLFSRFSGEIVEVGERRHRLPKFKKVDVLRLNRTNAVLLAHKDKNLWACFIKEGKVYEDDILSFIAEIKKTKAKTVNKILVTLDDMDINATLLAKENGLWIWGLKKLNTIMEIYNQEKIIRYT